jgi:AraC-like DNA-binding protein
MRIKDFVERNLGDFDLDPTMVAAALKLSPRYMNQLLELEGTSLSRYIWRRRLERAAADLTNFALNGLSISSIALNNGFSDLSHFSKAFRDRFAHSPSEYRHGAGRGANLRP